MTNQTDTLNVWYANGFYHIRYDGSMHIFADYLKAKAKIDEIMQNVSFAGLNTCAA